MKLIDLFCGCGGFSHGFQNVGYDIIAGFDNWQPAITVYKNNFKHPIINVDIGNLKEFAIFEYKADVVIGGPPCQDFSSAGKRTEGVRANLTIKFAEIISYLKPNYFVMENVERIITTKTLQQAIILFKKNGYGLTAKVLNASFYGVPQNRKRFFLIGIKNAQDDVLASYLDNTLTNKPLTIFDYLGNSLNIEHYYRHPRSYERRAVFSIYEPSPTIRGVNRPIPKNYTFHPKDTLKELVHLRSLTARERSYLQTFPIDFNWTGVTNSDLEQMIGNAVPVKMAEFIAKAIIHYQNHQLQTPKKNIYEQLSFFECI